MGDSLQSLLSDKGIGITQASRLGDLDLFIIITVPNHIRTNQINDLHTLLRIEINAIGTTQSVVRCIEA